ncbi:DUF4097 family beta strand repeat-containing protein [Neolewinella maritima]|nr:hypothetical protein [Neolewinella maritima]
MLRLILLLCLSSPLWAQQDYTLATGSKPIEFKEIDRLTIVGATGGELRIEAQRNGGKEDERAAGLRRISASGLTDNTGLGLSVTESDGRILVQQVGGDGKAVTVHVPNTASVSVEQSTHRGNDLSVRDFTGELDVSMMYNDVKLKNVRGPTAVSAVYGDVVGTWDAVPTQEIRLHSSYSDVDITLPAATKADVRLSTSYGNMYTDFDIQIKSNMTTAGADDRDRDRERLRDDEECNCEEAGHSGQLTGTINGGGPLLSLTATYDNLYIRKK